MSMKANKETPGGSTPTFGDLVLGRDGVVAQLRSGYEERPQQIRMANLCHDLVKGGGVGLIEAGTGCIQGDAEIVINRAGNGNRITLKELVHKFNGGVEYRALTGGGSSGWKECRWDMSIPTDVQREVDGVFRKGRLKAAWCSGLKTTYTLTTDTGRQIRATLEHPFLTERGWLKLGELRVGDEVHVVGPQRTTGRTSKPRYKAVYRMHAHPYACHRKNGSAAVDRHRLVAESAISEMAYEPFVEAIRQSQVSGLTFINPATHEVHHRDRNPSNDTAGNLEVLGHAEHARRHAEEGSQNNVLYKVALERVVSVECYGEEVTYDLEVEDDPHNFTANGFVVHNTGKSFAYLAAALLSGKRVIVSTDTIQLQEQLVRQDVPFLVKALGLPVITAIAKGKGNYLCPRNAQAFINESALIRPEETELAGQALDAFDASAWSGDRSDLQLNMLPRTWDELCADDTCSRKACPYYEGCPYMAAKAQLRVADLIIANHKLYLLDAHLGKRLLPEHGIWIADEAHTLAEQAQDVFGIEIKQSTPRNVVTRILKQASTLECEVEVDLKRVENTATDLFRCFEGEGSSTMLLSEFTYEARAFARERMSELVQALMPLRTDLLKLRDSIVPALTDDPPAATDRKSAVEAMAQRVDTLMTELQIIFHPDQGSKDEGLAPTVTFAETSTKRNGEPFVTLRRQPVETGVLMRSIHSELDATIFTSATLTTGAGSAAWGSIQAELGIEPGGASRLQVESPFDYAVQVAGFVPETVLPHTDPAYAGTVARAVRNIVRFTQGRAFILFTATQDMQQVAEELRKLKLGYPLLVQGGELSRDQLIEQFKSTGGVLLGVRTFWTGIDIPGDALSCVVIVKFPFPQSGHPLVKAKCALIKARGGSDFREFALPWCIRNIRQGFGRLIRTKRDRGLFVILDQRMFTKGYARQIAGALPEFPLLDELHGTFSVSEAA